MIAAACFSSALAEEDYDYDVDIAPILQQYCVKCHGPEKQKSKFRLDSYERLMRGGSSEVAPIIPYQPMQSPRPRHGYGASPSVEGPWKALAQKIAQEDPYTKH